MSSAIFLNKKVSQVRKKSKPLKVESSKRRSLTIGDDNLSSLVNVPIKGRTTKANSGPISF